MSPEAAAASVRADRGPLPDYQPQVGDRVRVSFEAEVYGPWDARLDPPNLHHFVGRGHTFVLPRDISVEKMEPEWRKGDVAQDALHRVFVRGKDNDGWLIPGQAGCAEIHSRTRLTLLVRNGRAIPDPAAASSSGQVDS